MGFLGGLAGTLGKIIETQGEEQRKESALMRSEDRAAARRFNEADNEMMIDGVLYHVLKGRDGNVISKRPFTEIELKERASADLKRSADDTENKEALNEETLYQEAVAKGFTGTKKQWNKSIEDAAADKTWEKRNKIEYAQQAGLANIRAANSPANLTESQETDNEIYEGLVKGTYKIGTDVSKARIVSLARAAQSGDGKSIQLLSKYMNSGYLEKVKGGNATTDPWGP